MVNVRVVLLVLQQQIPHTIGVCALSSSNIQPIELVDHPTGHYKGNLMTVVLIGFYGHIPHVTPVV